MTEEERDKKRQDIIDDFLSDLDMDQTIELWNNYCEDHGFDEMVYPNNEYYFNKHYMEATAYEIASDVIGSEYSFSDDYVFWDLYGPKSFDDLFSNYCPIDLDDIDAEEIIDLAKNTTIDIRDLKDALEEIDSEYEFAQAKEGFIKQWNNRTDEAYCFKNSEYITWVMYNPDDDTRSTGTKACDEVDGWKWEADQYTVTIDVDYDEDLEYDINELFDKFFDENNNFEEYD